MWTVIFNTIAIIILLIILIFPVVMIFLIYDRYMEHNFLTKSFKEYFKDNIYITLPLMIFSFIPVIFCIYNLVVGA